MFIAIVNYIQILLKTIIICRRKMLCFRSSLTLRSKLYWTDLINLSLLCSCVIPELVYNKTVIDLHLKKL